ncbi:MAG: two-component regulator propeller domain-containing protein [Bacteroidota bacterium]
MNPAKRYFLLLVVALLSATLVAETLAQSSLPTHRALSNPLLKELQLDHWSTNDELPGNRITAILQTNDGYLWIGTEKGLAQFDGLKFRVYNSANTPEMIHNVVTTMVEDKEGVLWIGTGGGGLLRFQNGAFTSHSQATGLSSNYIPALCCDRSGALWIGTSGGGLNRLDEHGVTRFTTKDGLATNFISTIFVDRTGTLWVAPSTGEIHRFKDGHFESVPVERGSVDDKISAFLEDGQGNLWAGSPHGLRKYRAGKFALDPLWKLHGGYSIHGLATDKQGALWIATIGHGIGRYNGRSFETLTTADGLSSNTVSVVSCDREGNLWVGTGGGGLHRLKKKLVQMLTTDDGLPTNYTRSVFEDRDEGLWVGTTAGLVRRLHGRFITYTRRQGLTSESIHPICQDSSGTIWIGTWGGGVTKFVDGRFEASPIPNRYIRAIHQDRNGSMWIGTNGGGLIHQSRDTLELFTAQKGLSNDFVSTIVENPSGVLWVGTSGGGINRIVGDSITVFNQSTGLSSNFIPSLYADGENALWIGTNGGGLNRLYHGTVSVWTTKDGLTDDIIYGIVEDNQRNLWMGTTRGIMRVNKDELIAYANSRIPSFPVLRISESDGMRTGECSSASQYSICQIRDGTLWFSTVDGVATLDPHMLENLPRTSPVYVERVLVDEVPCLPLSNVTALYKTGEIEIHYTAINLRDAAGIKFRYKLEGFDESWQRVGSRRTAYYTNVPPGSYEFHVMTEGNGDSRKSIVATIHISLLPPFWMTIWFRFGIAAVVIGIVAGAVRYASTRKLRQELQILEAQNALERERSRISKDMHDELGASLTRITLLSEVAKRTSGKKKETLKQLDRISDAARAVAATMDEIVWAVNPKYDTLEGLIAYTAQYVEDYLSLTEMRCRMDIPSELPEAEVPSEVRHNVFLVVKEALNNAVKYSSGNEFAFSVTVAGGQCILRLSDNGHGFATDDVRPFSDGLTNMRKRMEDVHAGFDLQSKRGVGTVLTLRIDLQGPKIHTFG